MVARSREEVRFASYLLHHIGEPAAVQHVLHALRKGFDNGLFDIHVESHNLFVEYDGGYFHNGQRTGRDSSKCLEKVNADDSARVLRVRVGDAAELQQIDHHRVSVVKAAGFNTSVGVACRALATLLGNPRLAQVPLTHSRCAEREGVADQVMGALDDNFNVQMQVLGDSVGSTAAQRISRVNGALARMQHGHFAQAVIGFKDALGLTTQQLVTVFGNSVAVRVKSQEFMDAAMRLCAAVGVGQMVSFMQNNSFAARVETRGFLDDFLPQPTRRRASELCRAYRPSNMRRV